MIPAYSPQARGRSERGFSTWQGRLPPELRAQQIKTLAGQSPLAYAASLKCPARSESGSSLPTCLGNYW